MRKCFIVGENQIGGQVTYLTVFENYVRCYENEAKSCNAKILQDFIAFLEVYKKRLGMGHGEFGKMVKQIPHTQ